MTLGAAVGIALVVFIGVVVLSALDVLDRWRRHRHIEVLERDRLAMRAAKARPPQPQGDTVTMYAYPGASGGPPPRCGVCGHPIDVSAAHVVIVRQVERVAGIWDGEPQHLVEDADVVVSYHQDCDLARVTATSPKGRAS